MNFTSSELHQCSALLFEPQLGAPTRQVLENRLVRHLSWMSRDLANEAYALGDHFSVVDAYLFTVLRWLPLVPFSLERWPGLVAYQARIKQRPSVVSALAAEEQLAV